MKFLLMSVLIASPIFACEVSDLSLDQKIGQLLMVAAVSNPTCHDPMITFIKSSPYTMDPDFIESCIKTHQVGGVIFLGVRGVAREQVAITKRFQAASGKIPLFIGLDAEWGLGMRLEEGAMSFPRAMTLGALGPDDEHRIRLVGREIGEHCKSVGVHINFAPVADVNTNPDNPIIGSRSFGDDTDAVARKAALYMQGLDDAGVLSCAKHFPGHGDTNVDSHHGLPLSDHTIERLNEVELVPFKHLIEQGVPAIMTAHMIVPALDDQMATVSHKILTDLLRTKLGFKGLIFTDGLGMQAVTNLYRSGEVAVKALKAGVDILLCPVNVSETVAAIKQAVADGVISEAEIDEKVTRILNAKQQERVQNRLYHPGGWGAQLSEDSKQVALQTYQAAMTRVGGDSIIAPGSRCVVIIPKAHMDANPFIAELSGKCSCDVYALEELTEAQLQIFNGADCIVTAAYLPPRFVPGSYSALAPYRILERVSAKKIMVLFGSLYYLPHLNRGEQWIIGYEHTHEAQICAARVVLGQLEPRGVLPIKMVGLSEQAKKSQAVTCLL